jgi:TetR/AcrR family transcriptional regulator
MAEAVADAEHTAERILRAAIAELAYHGYAGLRTDRVAAAAVCNKQMIYYYYGSKAGLRTAVLSRMVEEGAALWDRLDGLDVPGATEVTTSVAAQPGELWRKVLAWEGAEYASGESEIVLEERRTEAWNRLTAVFQAAQDRGEVPPDVDPRALALTFNLMTVAPHTLPQITRMITGREADDPELGASLRTAILYLAERAVAPLPRPANRPTSASARKQGLDVRPGGTSR